jgi:hypothetical protein
MKIRTKAANFALAKELKSRVLLIPNCTHHRMITYTYKVPLWVFLIYDY